MQDSDIIVSSRPDNEELGEKRPVKSRVCATRNKE